MRAHVKKGYTHSDVVDLRIVRQRGLVAFRAGVARYLDRAAEYRLDVLGCELSVIGTIVKRNKWGGKVITDMTPESAKYLARDYIDRAREWRQEFAA